MLLIIAAIYLMVSFFLLGAAIDDPKDKPISDYLLVFLWPALIMLIPLAIYAISRGGENCYDED